MELPPSLQYFLFHEPRGVGPGHAKRMILDLGTHLVKAVGFWYDPDRSCWTGQVPIDRQTKDQRLLFDPNVPRTGLKVEVKGSRYLSEKMSLALPLEHSERGTRNARLTVGDNEVYTFATLDTASAQHAAAALCRAQELTRFVVQHMYFVQYTPNFGQ